MNAHPRPNPPRQQGMSLMEVVIAAVIFAFLATSLVSLFIQNARLARAITVRTMATTIAIGVSEQIRANSYADFAAIHDDPKNKKLRIEFYDPTDASAPAGLRAVDVPINVTDGTQQHADWTEVTVPMMLTKDGTKTTVSAEMRFWVDSQRRQPTVIKDKDGNQVTVTRCQLFEIALVYQWRNVNYSSTKWHSGVIRMVTPNPDMDVPDTPVITP